LLPPLPSYIVAKIKSIPIVLTSDGLLWYYINTLNLRGYGKLQTFFGYAMETLDIKLNYDAFIAVSEEAKRELIHMGINANNIFIVHNGVDLEFYDRLEVQERDEPTICYVGHLEARKGILDLIRAFNVILKKIPDARLLIVGSGPLMMKAKEIAMRLRVSHRVDFIGEIKFREAAKIMKSSHVVVLPSLIEGFGIVLAEAGACGKPAIAYDIPAVRDIIIDGVNGFLVQPRNIEALANRIIEVLRDDNLRRKMGEAGKMIVKNNFTWDKAAQNTLKVYNYVLKN